MTYKTAGFDDEIVRRLQNGGVGLLPSDTIYGLSCRAMDEAAVNRIRELKGRDQEKSFIILISDTKMLDLLSISEQQANLIDKYWPGPLSVVFQAPAAPKWLRAPDGTLAVRLPDYPDMQNLIDKIGPLISTSANLTGSKNAASAKEAEQYFDDKLDFYVDAGDLDNQPSTIVSINMGKLRVLRQGAARIS